MGADEFRVYILGFIFFTYLSEKAELWADGLLTTIATLLISLGIRVG
jgi:type I restriction-modification system DNA methylase subunit